MTSTREERDAYKKAFGREIKNKKDLVGGGYESRYKAWGNK